MHSSLSFAISSENPWPNFLNSSLAGWPPPPPKKLQIRCCTLLADAIIQYARVPPKKTPTAVNHRALCVMQVRTHNHNNCKKIDIEPSDAQYTSSARGTKRVLLRWKTLSAVKERFKILAQTRKNPKYKCNAHRPQKKSFAGFADTDEVRPNWCYRHRWAERRNCSFPSVSLGEK